MKDETKLLLGFIVISAFMVWLDYALNSPNGIRHTENPISKSNKFYQEVPITLSDGTPCTVLRGGTHSGYIGVTCDYLKKVVEHDSKTTEGKRNDENMPNAKAR